MEDRWTNAGIAVPHSGCREAAVTEQSLGGRQSEEGEGRSEFSLAS